MSRAPDSPAGNDRAALDTLDRDALIAAWRRIVKTPAPKGISRRLMVQILTYEAQVQQRGGLMPAVRRLRAKGRCLSRRSVLASSSSFAIVSSPTLAFRRPISTSRPSAGRVLSRPHPRQGRPRAKP